MKGIAADKLLAQEAVFCPAAYEPGNHKEAAGKGHAQQGDTGARRSTIGRKQGDIGSCESQEDEQQAEGRADPLFQGVGTWQCHGRRFATFTYRV